MIYQDFSINRYEDATLVISLTPPTSIAGWTIRWMGQHRFGGISGIVQKWMGPGNTAGQSGISVMNQNTGIFQVQVNSADLSGYDYGNLATTSERMDPGFRTILTEGYCLLSPSAAP